MYYWDNGESVYGGHDPDYDCGAFQYPLGWYIANCQSWWWPIGRDQVYVKAKGTFGYHTLDAAHWQTAKFTGTPGERGSYECDHYGHVPGPVYWDCDGQDFED